MRPAYGRASGRLDFGASVLEASATESVAVLREHGETKTLKRLLASFFTVLLRCIMLRDCLALRTAFAIAGQRRCPLIRTQNAPADYDVLIMLRLLSGRALPNRTLQMVLTNGRATA